MTISPSLGANSPGTPEKHGTIGNKFRSSIKSKDLAIRSRSKKDLLGTINEVTIPEEDPITQRDNKKKESNETE